WVLTPAHCLYTADSPDRHFVLSTPNFVEIYKPDAEEASVNLVGRTTASKILRLKVHPNYQRPGDESLSKSRRYSSFDFAMLELDPPIRLSPHEQPINLPWTSECYQFVDNARCKVSSTKYFNDSSRLVFEPLMASSVLLPNGQCHKGPSFFCYEQQKTTPKTGGASSGHRRGTDGSGVVVKRNDFYELIGMILNAEEDWRTSKSSPSSSLISDTKINILTICEILQWINTTVTNN
uniref:Peptidase S1 domain-containing protein n=1 Tax=Romanomermis culicivorax TaxID=13658 RepID=A0A915KRZ0_ROMCU